MNPYAKFGVMIATSTVVMFGLMYLNTYQLDHVFFSETRAFMALGNVMCVGGSWMLESDWVRRGDWERIRIGSRDALQALV